MPRTAAAQTINLDSLTDEDRDTVLSIAVEGGFEPNLWHLVDMSNPPLPVLAGLIYVTMRRTEPRITARRCVKLALSMVEARNG